MSDNSLPLSATISDAKHLLRENFKDGIKCPCCDQFVKMYRRPITSAMAYALILFYKESAKQHYRPWIHADRFFKDQDCPPSIRGDFPKLVYWGLLMKGEGESLGSYMITTMGEQFVRGEIHAVSHILFYNNKCYGAPEDFKYISIKDALKKKFDYNKLMSNTL